LTPSLAPSSSRPQGLGLNLVRLGVLLVGTLPAPSPPGVANATYLAAAAATVQMLAARGVATLVDLHQDVLSPYFCGEGLPDWAVQKGLDMVHTCARV
jgi:endoglycosylceramidase